MKNNQQVHTNKITTTLPRHAFMVLVVLGFLTACGQRGSLYLPTVPEAAQRSSMLESLTTPASIDTDVKTTSSTRAPMTQPAKK